MIQIQLTHRGVHPKIHHLSHHRSLLYYFSPSLSLSLKRKKESVRANAMEQSSDHSEATGRRQSSGHSSRLSANLDQKVESSAWGIPCKSNAYHGSSDASLFSSSLPVLPHEKLNFTDSKPRVQSTDDASSKLNKDGSDMEGKDSLDDLDLHCIGSLLPDDEDELLAGIMDDFDLSGLPSQVEELEEYDLFGSGGGMELDSDPIQTLNIAMSNARFSDGYTGTGIVHYNVPNNVAALVGEHPYGEHPSRTLFVRNINSNVEDSELLSLFEQYGDIRTLYTACKHRGFVMVSYYDIRDARTAMNALQNKPLRRRKLDIHFSIPKDNPSDKDMNQGTLVAFNLDPSVSNDDLLQIFGVYGEVKEIRETPHKRHHKFIEFYDVRAAEAALQSLNRSDIAGKRIKLEPSRPGGARRNLMQQLSQEEQDETRICRHPMGSPITTSPTALMGSWAHFSTSGDNGPQEALSKSPTFGAMSPMGINNHLPGLASVLTPLVRSNSVKIAPIGKDRNRIIPDDQISPHGVPIQHPHSFPEHSSGMMMSGPTTSKTPGIATLNGPQFLWGSPTPNSESSQSSAWQSPSTGHSFTSNGHVGNGIVYSNHNGSFIASPHQQCHHVGSAPPGDPFERHFGYRSESPETPFMSQAAFGSMGINRKEANLMSLGSRAPMNPGLPLPGSMFENGLPSFRMLHSHSFGPTLVGSAPYPVPRSFGIEGLLERNHSRRIDNGAQIDNKKQYQLDLEKVVIGEDTRTTLMIKNIPNKYTSKMLLAAIDENHKCTYDFLYLPIDFKNKCNVGYAFINMVSPSHIISFYQAFNGKRWEKFNSEKVASLAYARIQGKTALIAHFQNSSLMNEDKRCRPIIFHSGGPEVGDQEPFRSNGLNIFCVRKQDLPESPTEESS